MTRQQLELYVFQNAHWLFWAFTGALIIGAMALTVSATRTKRKHAR